MVIKIHTSNLEQGRARLRLSEIDVILAVLIIRHRHEESTYDI
jgi:hypothetical protein